MIAMLPGFLYSMNLVSAAVEEKVLDGLCSTAVRCKFIVQMKKNHCLRLHRSWTPPLHSFTSNIETLEALQSFILLFIFQVRSRQCPVGWMESDYRVPFFLFGMKTVMERNVPSRETRGERERLFRKQTRSVRAGKGKPPLPPKVNTATDRPR